MKQAILKNKRVLTVLTVCLVAAVVTMSFRNNAFGPLYKLDTFIESQDTIPDPDHLSESKMTIQDFDNLLLNMDLEMLKEDISKIDVAKIQSGINESISKIDFDKIQLSIDKAMKEIDFSKIEKEVASALKSVELNKVDNEVKNSLREAKRQIEKIDFNDLKKDMENAKLEIQKSREIIKNINMENILETAGKSVSNAKEAIKLKKEMFNEMEKDGLIDQKKGFVIDYKNRTLIINGKKQSDKIADKYHKYIKEGSFRISIKKQ